MTDFFSKVIPFFLLTCAWTFRVCGDAAGGAAPWRTLTHVQNAIGVTNYVWDGDSLCFSNGQNLVRFYQGRRRSDVNGTTVWLNALPDGSVSGGNWRLSGIDLDLLQFAVLPQEESALKPVRVILDPGHGGDDEGARSKNPVIKEKDLTLTLAKRIGAQLKKAGLRVDYTRSHDTTVSLDERSRIARSKKADLFISIHANYAANNEADGVETYVLPPSGYPGTAEGSRARGWQIGNRNDYQNTLLGFSVHQKLSAQTRATDRGLKRQSFFVLRETSCPAVLLEFGFLSNPTETRRMLESVWQERCATAVAEGVLAYARKVDALEKTMAAKRIKDEEANARWRQHLAARNAKAPADLAAATNTHRSASAQASAACRPESSGMPVIAPSAMAVFSNTVASAAPVALAGTNSAPLEIDTLVDFYATGKVH
ncbi:MAG TPA: N-acetylmuramoyl-L-alanine amidase [Kiritimatiellia bacterium]|nr:N-acetylmuramoyl-L-alanine amidase [Kiritimatiellia bacterium]HPS09236.1 N-acetylmuramoyl-L-alanine amidase [Kiritimatiellia bacterium]